MSGVDPLQAVQRRDFRLIPIAAAAWCGSLAGLFGAVIVPVVAFLGAVVAPGFFRRSPAIASTVAAISFTALAACTVSSLTLGAHQADPLAAVAESGQPVRVRLRIVSDPALKESPWGSVSLVAQSRALHARDGPVWFPSNVEIRLQAPENTRMFRGDIVVAFGRIDDSFGARPPAVGTLRARTVVVERPVTGWREAAVRVKERLVNATAGLPDHARGLIPGMAVGDDRLLSPQLRESMLTASLVHLTAVSGSHIAIVVGLLMTVIPGRGGARQIATAMFLAVLVAVVGPEPSVLRAVGSAAVVGGGLLLKRSSQPQIALAAVVVAAVMINPWLAVDSGFTLSVLATWGIVYAGRAWIERARAWIDPDRQASAWRRVLLWLIQAVFVSFAAQLWVLPVTLLMNPWVPLWGVLANVSVLPAVPPITLLGLAAAAVSGLSPALAHWLCWAAVPFTHWTQSLSTFISALPLARLPWPAGIVGVVAAVGLVGLVTVATVPPITRRTPRTARKEGGTNGGRNERNVGDRSGRGVFGSHSVGQRVRGGVGRPGRHAGPPFGARAGPRHRAD